MALNRLGAQPSEIVNIYMAGAFGTYIPWISSRWGTPRGQAHGWLSYPERLAWKPEALAEASSTSSWRR